jgi:hypothetical protein
MNCPHNIETNQGKKFMEREMGGLKKPKHNNKEMYG